MPYRQLTIPSGTQIGHEVDAAFGKAVTRVTLIADGQLRIAETGMICKILSATSEDGRTKLFVSQPPAWSSSA